MGNDAAGEADGVVQMAGPRVAPWMIRGVLMGGSLLALLLARALVALGRCGAIVPIVAASFLASLVAPEVSVVG